jgi:transposase InsO family protein
LDPSLVQYWPDFNLAAGWQAANHMRTELALEALEMALWRRRIKTDSGLIHHSDNEYVKYRMSRAS